MVAKCIYVNVYVGKIAIYVQTISVSQYEKILDCEVHWAAWEA